MLSGVRVPDGSPAPLAQLVEQLTLNQWVRGSSPRRCTKEKDRSTTRLFCWCILRRRVRGTTVTQSLSIDNMRRRASICRKANSCRRSPACGKRQSLPKVHQTRIKRTLMKIQSSFYFLQEIISDLKSNVK